MARITMSLSDNEMQILTQIAESMNKRPGDVAKQIVQETIESMFYIFTDTGEEPNKDVATRRMFKMAFSQMLKAIEEIDDLKK